MNNVIQPYKATDIQYLPSEQRQAHWYAIHTRARHEKKVEARLRHCGIATFLPVLRQTHRWSDRRKTVELPLFACYIFVHITPTPTVCAAIVRTDGILGLVGVRGEGTPIPDHEIDNVRSLISNGVPFSEYPFLKIGDRVRIRGGSLDGMEGAIVVGNGGSRKLVLSVELIQRSVAVTLEGYDFEVIN